MKRTLLILTICLLLCGCGKKSKEDVVKDFKNTINSVKSYKTTGSMEINNDEEKFTYSLESYYLKDNYYKVILINQTNNHEQVLLKIKEDVYVITPSLNKSFKFQSEWPNNSSQAYLLNSLVKDIENDNNLEVSNTDNGYIIKTKVNYPNNNNLSYQKIYMVNNNVEKVEVYDTNDIIKIKVTYNDINLNANIAESEFKLENYITENEDNCENDSSCNEENNAENSKKSINVENIIYPLYIPSNTYLTSSETIDNNGSNRIILTFSGEKNFVLIEEANRYYDSMEIVPVYGDPLMLSESIGALSANSLSWDVNDISYYLASTELTIGEMENIANSLGNNTLVAKTK